MNELAFIALAVWFAGLANCVLNLLLIRRLEPDGTPAGPDVSVIIPARNEQAAIEQTIRSFLEQRYQDLEIIVVNDRSEDDTGRIAERLAQENPRVQVIRGAPPPSGWLGKPWALHQGSRRARGTWLLFVDADLNYAPETLAACMREVDRSGVAMLTLLPRIEMESFWEQVAMPMLAFTFFVLLPSWLANRTRIPRLGLGGGTGNLVRRAAYEQSGGHEALKRAVVDDIGLARLLRRHGHATRVARADHLISLRMYRGARDIIDGFTKNVFAAFGRSYVAVAGWLAAGLAFSLLPYVFAVAGSRAALLTVMIITATRLLLFASLRYRLDNAALGHPFMMLFWAAIMLRSTWITGVRGRVPWRGRVYEAAGT